MSPTTPFIKHFLLTKQTRKKRQLQLNSHQVVLVSVATHVPRREWRSIPHPLERWAGEHTPYQHHRPPCLPGLKLLAQAPGIAPRVVVQREIDRWFAGLEYQVRAFLGYALHRPLLVGCWDSIQQKYVCVVGEKEMGGGRLVRWILIFNPCCNDVIEKCCFLRTGLAR